MACVALARSPFVDRDFALCGIFLHVMTHAARHIFVGAAQRERRARFMVEQCGGPAAGGMTSGAVHRVVTRPELALVDVLMTALAPGGRHSKWQLALRLRGNRPMTRRARQRLMRAGETEGGKAVIERLHLLPAGDHVARLAKVRAGCAIRRQRCRKIAVVRVLMTARACLVGEMEIPWRSGGRHVAFLAAHCEVGTFQCER